MTSTLDRNVRRIAAFDIVELTAGLLPALLVQIAFGVGCTAMVMSTRWMLDFVAPAVGPYALTYPAILIATLFGRWRSGLTTFVTSALLIWFYILPGGQYAESVSPEDAPRFAVDVATMLFILVFAEIFRRAICEANESLAKVGERTRPY